MGLATNLSSGLGTDLDSAPPDPVEVQGHGIPDSFVREPTGGGVRDIGILMAPASQAAGSSDSSYQFDSATGSAKTEDWYGYTFVDAFEFHSVVFQEGKHFAGGGWFTATPQIQVRVNGVWTAVTGQTVSPAYDASGTTSYQTFTFEFNPVVGDGIRVYGTPAGSSTFTSAAGLRVYAVQINALQDLTMLGTSSAFIDPPTGGDNHNHSMFRSTAPISANDIDNRGGNDVFCYDTFNGGGARASEWFALTMPATCTFRGVVFTEGDEHGDGGWFDSIKAQILVNGVWTDAPGASISPAYAGANGSDYDSYTFTFNPTAGTAVRIFGAPGGSAHFASCSRLQVIGSHSLGTHKIVGGTPHAKVLTGGTGSPFAWYGYRRPYPKHTHSDVLYTSNNGAGPHADDYWGYTYPTEFEFHHLLFCRGLKAHYFASYEVQVLVSAVWTAVANLSSDVVFPTSNTGDDYQSYLFSFTPTVGAGIRLYGVPGAAGYTSVSQVDAWGKAA